MDSFMYIALTIPTYCSIVICNPDNFIYGISEKDSFKASFDEAVRHLNNNSSNTFIQINPNQGLKQIIETGLTFTSALQQHNQDSVFLFTDLNNQQNGIIREVLGFHITILQNANLMHIDSRINLHEKEKDQRQEIDALFAYLNRLSSPTNGLSVIVDNSQLGHDAFIQIIKNCIESGREIIGHYILEGEVTEEALLALNLHHSNSLFTGIDQSSFQRVVNMTEEMGLVSFNHNLRMFMTRRSIAGITGVCYKPKYNYYIATSQLSPSNATYIVDKVNRCWRSNDKMGNYECLERNGIYMVKKFDIDTNSWKNVQVSGKEATAHSDDNELPTRPTITAAIANSTPPWIFIEDFQRPMNEAASCGRKGMIATRFSGLQKVDICAYGFAIDILRSLQAKLNFNYKIIVSRDGLYGTFDKDTNKSNGIVREIIESFADIGLELMETKSRSLSLWFSKPHMISHIGFSYLRPGLFRDTNVFKPFGTNLWVGILVSIACATVFVWAFERFSPYGHYQTNKRSITDDEHTFSIFDSISFVWGTYFTGEIIFRKPCSFGSRATIVFVSVAAIIIISAYSANLLTYLVVEDETAPINGLVDERLIGENPTIRIGASNGSFIIGYLQHHSDIRLRRLGNRIQLCSMEKCIQYLKQRKLDVVLDDYYVLKHFGDIDKDCSMKVIQLEVTFSVSIASRKSWTWNRRLDTAVISMVESGEADYLKKKWFNQRYCTAKNTFHAIDILKLKDLFTILIVSAFVSLVVLTIEIIWKRALHIVGPLHCKIKQEH